MSSSDTTSTALASAKADNIKTNIVLVDAKAGNDRITGGAAAQTIYGGSGNDVLQGAGGNDILWGDGSSTGAGFVAGTDSFVFEKTLVANGLDTVMDFGIAGHKANGVLQGGSYVADSLDLSRIKFTGLPHADEHEANAERHEEDEESEEVHITSANINDYVSVQGGNLFIDTDGLGAGKAEVWAHLNGVSGGDLVNVKFDDFTGQIEAKNALASISFNSAGAVVEDGQLLASGALSVADTDRGENTFQAAANLKGSYGDFSFNATTGSWSFALDNAAAQTLHADESVEQLLTVKSLDGSATQTITVTVQGAQDAAVITGNTTGALTEDEGVSVAQGTLSVADADHGESSFRAADSAALKGHYGNFSFNETSGAWSYTLDNTATAVQALAAGEKQTDSLTVATADGTQQLLSITITGTNDAAVITGNSTAAVTETNAALSASGQLAASDVDSSNAFTVQTDITGGNGYGTFSIATDGSWTYSAGAHNEFVLGQEYTDSLTVATADGTQQVLSVTITGANDVAAFSGDTTGTVTEDATLAASGILVATDADHDESSFQVVDSAALKGSYGDFSFNAVSGAWSYALDNTSAQPLRSDAPVSEVLTVTSLDGSATQTITVTVNGSADRVSAPTVCLERGDSNDNVLIGPSMIKATELADTLIGTKGNDVINGLGGNDVIYGLGGEDTLIGLTGNDTIYGGPGDDFIAGRLDNDTLYGGSGNDEITGGKGGGLFFGGFGADKLVGGTTVDAPNSSIDTFKFIDIRDTGDTIYLFDAGRDKLDFSTIDANANIDGNQTFTLTSSLETQAFGVNWFVEGGNTIVQFDNDGVTSTAEFEITLIGNTTLTAANFVL